jgi:hypothetical protein
VQDHIPSNAGDALMTAFYMAEFFFCFFVDLVHQFEIPEKQLFLAYQARGSRFIFKKWCAMGPYVHSAL